jgi:hypothetical protein
MARSTKTQANSKLIWKQGDGWIQFNPPRSHPSYEEWQKMKQKEKEEHERTTD